MAPAVPSLKIRGRTPGKQPRGPRCPIAGIMGRTCPAAVLLYDCFWVIEAHGGPRFPTPYPNCRAEFSAAAIAPTSVRERTSFWGNYYSTVLEAVFSCLAASYLLINCRVLKQFFMYCSGLVTRLDQCSMPVVASGLNPAASISAATSSALTRSPASLHAWRRAPKTCAVGVNPAAFISASTSTALLRSLV